MLKPYTITLHVYANDDEEAKALEDELLLLVKQKYDEGVYIRAKALTGIVKRYGSNKIINNFIR